MPIPLQKEYDVFLSQLDDFVSDHMNEFVLIKGEEVINFFKSYEEALKDINKN